MQASCRAAQETSRGRFTTSELCCGILPSFLPHFPTSTLTCRSYSLSVTNVLRSMKPKDATRRPRARSDPGVFTPDREDIELQPIDAPIGPSPALSPIEIPTRCSTESMSTDASLDPGHSTCDAETTAPGQCREAIIMEPTVGEPTKSAQPDQATQTCMEETVTAQQENSSTAAALGSESAQSSIRSRSQLFGQENAASSEGDLDEIAMIAPIPGYTPSLFSFKSFDGETAKFGQ
jgi:hypothetical protein